MKRRSKQIAALFILSGALLVLFAGVAVAGPPWSDASNAWWQSSYGVTDTQVATVADGFPDGTFKPGTAVTRGQFAKMAVSGLGVATADPNSATFKDVIPSHRFYIYVEGAYAAELIGGYPSGGALYFKPDSKITRQQANSILGRYLSQLEIDITGSIHGDVSTYGSLDLWYAAEGSFYLNKFDDAGKVASSHKATTAYLAFRDIVEGSNGKLSPGSTLLRSQAAALILRVKAEAEAIKTPPPAPTNLAVTATGGKTITYNASTQKYVGNDSTPQITGDTLASRPIAIYDGGVKLVEDTSNAAGKFYTDVSSALADGTHVFTAKVKNTNGLVSAASGGATYVLDTVQPTGSITKPMVPSGQTALVLTSNKPEFTATATDELSGVKQVDFQYAVKQTSPAWQSISIDTAPDSGTTTYAAVWPTSGSLSGGLTEGQYLLRVVITDNAGNERISSTVEVMLDSVRPTVTITSPLGTTGQPAYTESTTPTFSATAGDPTGTGGGASGVAKVEFYYVGWTTGTKPSAWSQFTLLSTDTTAPYEAVYPSGGLSEGRYIFAVRAYDVTGNDSVLTSGGTYVAGVTQEVVIDATAPLVTVAAAGPYGSDTVEEKKENGLAITWTVTDVTPPDTVKLEYTLDASVVSPTWVVIEMATANDGSYMWTTPDITGDKPHAAVRITVIDKAGLEVGDVVGHTTVAQSAQFTIFDLPLPVTNLMASDTDDDEAGVDGRDFHASWTVSASSDIVAQRVYILPVTVTSLDLGSHQALKTFSNNTAETWTGTASDLDDSAGHDLDAGFYKIWIVVTDSGGRIALTASAAFEVVAD